MLSDMRIDANVLRLLYSSYLFFSYSLFSNRRECVGRQHRFFNIVFIREPRGLGARTHPTRINGLLV